MRGREGGKSKRRVWFGDAEIAAETFIIPLVKAQLWINDSVHFLPVNLQIEIQN